MLGFKALVLAGVAASFAAAQSSTANVTKCSVVDTDGCTPRGTIQKVNGIDTYFTYPRNGYAPDNKTILFLTDIYGLPAVVNQLLADSLANDNYNVVLPDLFYGDAIPSSSPEGTLNLTSWQARHPAYTIDPVIETIISYIRGDLGVKRLAGVGYCFGGKFVPRFLATGKGIDLGFIAHPSNLTDGEIQSIAKPISIAAGELDTLFNKTLRRRAEDLLQAQNATYETSLYAKAKHGFGVRINTTAPLERYAKAASYRQALEWFDAWL